jgi:hypothetical protein
MAEQGTGEGSSSRITFIAQLMHLRRERPISSMSLPYWCRCVPVELRSSVAPGGTSSANQAARAMGPREPASNRPWAILQAKFTRCGEPAFSSRSPVGTRSRHLASQPQTTPMRTFVDVGKPFTLPISGHRKVLQTARVGSPAKLPPRMAGVICKAEKWSRICEFCFGS